MRHRQLLPTFALIRRSSGSFNIAVNSRNEPNSRNCLAPGAEFSVLDFDRFLFKPLTQDHRPFARGGVSCVAGRSLSLP
jgi:hypothetical protein